MDGEFLSNVAPIQIYLDSSDYSDLSGRENNAELMRQYDSLRRLVDQEIIQVRYSGITLLESAHISEQYLEFAIARAKVIGELCVGNALMMHNQMHRIECLNCAKGSITTRDQVFRPNDAWMVDFSEFAIELEASLISRIKSDIGPFPRKKRREMEKKIFKNGRIRPDCLLDYSGNIEQYSAALLNQYPFLEQVPILQIFHAYLEGSITPDQFGALISRECLSPLNFTKHFYDVYRREPKAYQDILRTQGTAFVEMIERFRQQLVNLKELASELGRSQKEVTQRFNHLKSQWKSRRNILLERIYAPVLANRLHLPQEEVAAKLVDADPGAMPSLDFTIQLAWQLAILKAVDQQTTLMQSDYGDLVHANYVPYVDVFRADKRTKPVIEKICSERGLNTYIASSIDKVLEYVDHDRGQH